VTRIAQLDLFTASTVKLVMTPKSDNNAEITIAEVTGGSCSGNEITILPDTEVEVLFKIFTDGEMMLPIEFSQVDSSEPEFTTSTLFKCEVKASMQLPKSGITSVWPDEIPEEYIPILEHIKKHGAATEKWITEFLGGGRTGARKGRKFAASLIEWQKANLLPFALSISDTSEGKEYRISE
jgi:hypothetical protein